MKEKKKFFSFSIFVFRVKWDIESLRSECNLYQEKKDIVQLNIRKKVSNLNLSKENGLTDKYKP